MNSEELRRWADGQVQTLIECGIAPLDAENTIKRVLAMMPEGVDPNTWVPTRTDAEVVITEADIEDSRANWYASVRPEFARLLDAQEEE